MLSRPQPFEAELLDRYEKLGLAMSGYFQSSLRDQQGQLLSCCTGIVDGDTAVMLYQLNHRDFPDLGLTMTLRGYLIEHCIAAGIRRLVLPMGISGHLEHAATTNSVVEVQLIHNSLGSIAKAVMMRHFAPQSQQAMMTRMPGFFASAYRYHFEHFNHHPIVGT